MAVAHVQTVKTARGFDGTSTLTRSITATSGNLLLAAVCIKDTGSGNPTCSGVTWNGAAMTQRITRQTSTTDSRIYIFSLANITGATANVVATLNSAGPVGALFVVEVSGAATSSEEDGVGASATGSSTNPASGNFTASAADDFWLACFVNEAAGSDATIAAGSGWTQDATNGRHTDGSAGARSGVEYRENPGSAGAFNGNFTAATGAWSAAVFAFKAAAGGGGGSTVPVKMRNYRNRRVA